MSANRSSAVMAQRSEPHDSLDDFPTPPWAARAFCEWLNPAGDATVWEPAANRGYMVKALEDYFLRKVFGSDVHDCGYRHRKIVFTEKVMFLKLARSKEMKHSRHPRRAGKCRGNRERRPIVTARFPRARTKHPVRPVPAR